MMFLLGFPTIFQNINYALFTKRIKIETMMRNFNLKFILTLCISSTLYANELQLDKKIISEAFPHFNELQQQEIYDLIHKTNDKLAANFKNLELQVTICKHNLQFNKITCNSKNDSDHFKKELNSR